MKLFFSLLFCILAFASLAQSSFSYEVFYSVDDLSGSDYLSSTFNEGFFIEYGAPNYSMGINAIWTTNQKLFLVSGINYSKQEFIEVYNCPVCDFLGDIVPEERSLEYVQIPIGVSYRFLNKKVTPEVEAGFFNNILVAGNKKTIFEEASSRDFYFAGYVGGRIHYQVFDFVGIHIGYRRMNSLSSPFSSDFTFKSDNYVFGITVTPGSF